MNSLVKFWSKCSLDQPPYAHPDDVKTINANPKFFDTEIKSVDQFLRSTRFGDFKDNRFHLSLYPVPYLGRLNTAKIVILMLNPGFGLSDYVTRDDKDHAHWTKKVLRQDLKGAEYPFISLNPEFAWTGGFNWWEKKLQKVLTIIAERKFRGRYLRALGFLSKRIACVELVPYRSKQFVGSKGVKSLPSVQAAKKYVNSVLVPKAKQGEIKLIVTRKVVEWGLPKHRNIICYNGGLARGASLGPNTRGGKAILNELGIKL